MTKQNCHNKQRKTENRKTLDTNTRDDPWPTVVEAYLFVIPVSTSVAVTVDGLLLTAFNDDDVDDAEYSELAAM